MPYCIIRVRIHSMQFARGNLIQGPICRDVGTAENIDSICPLQHLEINHFFPHSMPFSVFPLFWKRKFLKQPARALEQSLDQLCGISSAVLYTISSTFFLPWKEPGSPLQDLCPLELFFTYHWPKCSLDLSSSITLPASSFTSALNVRSLILNAISYRSLNVQVAHGSVLLSFNCTFIWEIMINVCLFC